MDRICGQAAPPASASARRSRRSQHGDSVDRPHARDPPNLKLPSRAADAHAWPGHRTRRIVTCGHTIAARGHRTAPRSPRASPGTLVKQANYRLIILSHHFSCWSSGGRSWSGTARASPPSSRPGQGRGKVAADVGAEQPARARARRDQAKQAADGGDLAGPVRPGTQTPHPRAPPDQAHRPLPDSRHEGAGTACAARQPRSRPPASNSLWQRPKLQRFTAPSSLRLGHTARSAHAGLCASPRLCWPTQPLGALRHIPLMSERRRLKMSPRATWLAPPLNLSGPGRSARPPSAPPAPPWRSERTQASANGEVRRHNPPEEPDQASRRLHPDLLGQLADLRRRIAPVTTKRPQKRELAFLGPAGHRLGRHLQDVGHLRGPQVTGKLRGGLAAGWGCHGASLSCGGPAGAAGPEVEQLSVGGLSKDMTREMLVLTLLSAERTGRSCRPSQLPAIVRLGYFSASVA
jgi:hypothetical protein